MLAQGKELRLGLSPIVNTAEPLGFLSPLCLPWRHLQDITSAGLVALLHCTLSV